MKGTGHHWRVVIAGPSFVVQRWLWNGWVDVTRCPEHGEAMRAADHLARRGHRRRDHGLARG